MWGANFWGKQAWEILTEPQGLIIFNRTRHLSIAKWINYQLFRLWNLESSLKCCSRSSTGHRNVKISTGFNQIIRKDDPCLISQHARKWCKSRLMIDWLFIQKAFYTLLSLQCVIHSDCCSSSSDFWEAPFREHTLEMELENYNCCRVRLSRFSSLAGCHS